MSKTNSTTKAERATIKLGDIELEVFQLPDGTYRFSLSQVTELLGFKKTKGSSFLSLEAVKTLSTYTLQGSSFITSDTKQKIKGLTVDAVMAILGYYGFKGNLNAQAILMASFAESLERRADNAFGIQRSEEERNNRQAERMTHAKQYHPLYTIWIQKDGATQGWEYGQAINALKNACGLPLSPVDQYDHHQLSRLNQCERLYDSLRHMGLSHVDSLNHLYRQNQKLGLVLQL